MEKCTICGFDHTVVAMTHQMCAGSATITMPQLTESEKSRLFVIRREVGRGYALTMNDIQFLVDLTFRAGL